MAFKGMSEEDETPAMEAEEHPKGFLKKATRLASSGRGAARGKRAKKKKTTRKRVFTK